MTVQFVADAEVTNGTAGTSVVVSRPSGTTDGHLLVAFIACVGSATISTPAGWTLIGTQNPGSAVRLSAFWKVASSEPASWTWTLGSSQRNWGWVGAYSGVDVDDPFGDTFGTGSSTPGTAFNVPAGNVTLTAGFRGVSAIAAVRTAGGSATTWTGSSQNERADLSTNAGAGTDICGQAQDSVYLLEDPAFYGPSWTASQSQTNAAMWALALSPAFVAYDGGLVGLTVEAAFGYDSTSDPDDMVWTDITADVRVNPGVSIRKGAGPDSDQMSPTSITFELNNFDGDYTPGHPTGANFPNIQPDTPIRVTVPYGYAPPTQRAFGFVDSWAPFWDISTKAPAVAVTAYGRSFAIQQNNIPLRSALYRRMTLRSVIGFVVEDLVATAHWSMEDGANATQFACSMPDFAPLEIVGTVDLAAASDLPGSAPLPVLGANGSVRGGVSYVATGQWCWVVAVKPPTTPFVSTMRLLQVDCTGTARTWTLEVVPGAPDEFHTRAYDAAGTMILDDSFTINEADWYGSWMLLSLGVTQDGSDVDYNGGYRFAESGFTGSGTLSSRTIGATTNVRVPVVEGMACGHLGVYTDPDFDIANDPAVIAFSGLDGDTGELASARADRLAGEQGIGLKVVTGDEALDHMMRMGPQGIGTLASLLNEPADSDHSQLHDGGTDGELVFVTRTSKYNAAVAMTIDYDQRELQPGFEPKFDTQRRVTKSTVSRVGGSAATYELAGARGPRADSANLSLQSDSPLMDLAAWRVRLGTVEGMRYTQLPINLRRTPDLLREWLYCRIGSRVQAVNLMTTHGPDDADTVMDGYSEVISKDRWVAVPNCSPAEPYIVGVVEDTELGRVDTDGSTLLSGVDADDTAWVVSSVEEPWITTADHPTMLPVDWRIGGERVTATAIASLVRDTFTRSVTDGWSTSDSGHTWVLTGAAAADWDVNGTKGLQTNPSTNVIHYSTVDTGSTDNRIRAYLNLGSATLTGAGATAFLPVRYLDSSNWYAARLGYATTGVVTLQLAKMIGGVGAIIGTSTWTLGTFGNYGTTQFIVIAQAVGSIVRAKAWDSAAAEAPVWQAWETDTDLTTGTSVGLAGRRDTGNLEANLVFAWDNFVVQSPQTATVTRSVNGVSKSHAAGADVSLWTPMRAAL